MTAELCSFTKFELDSGSLEVRATSEMEDKTEGIFGTEQQQEQQWAQKLGSCVIGLQDQPGGWTVRSDEAMGTTASNTTYLNCFDRGAGAGAGAELCFSCLRSNARNNIL
ncbi:hypothetical protein Tco_0671916 [Tanacetum coccineum]